MPILDTPKAPSAPPDLTTVAGRIVSARLAKNMTQNQLAAAIGTTRPSVGMWETNACIPSLPKVIALSKALDVTVEWLATGN